MEEPGPRDESCCQQDEEMEVGLSGTSTQEDQKTTSKRVHESSIHFVDDFSLKSPSSSVRFRGNIIRVHDLRSSQIQLEEQQFQTTENGGSNDDTEIIVRNIHDSKTFGLNILRATYTLSFLFFCGILFTMCFYVLLFLFMDFVAYLGTTSRQARDVMSFLGTLFAVPLFIFGLASAMAIAGTALVDIWNGNRLLRTVADNARGIILIEWLTFGLFLVIPFSVVTVALFASYDDWWSLGLLTWFSCVSLYYVFFACFVIFYEMKAAWFFLHELEPSADPSWFTLLRRAIIVRQTYRLSGSSEFVRMSEKLKEKEGGKLQVINNKLFRKERTHLYTKMTLLPCCGRLFEKVDPPERIYSTEDILRTRQFLTFKNWSLEKVFCSSLRSQTVAIVRGPSALDISQMRSSVVCSILGTLMVILMLLALTLWFVNGGFIAAVVVVVCFTCIPRFRSSIRIFKMYKQVDEETSAEDEENESEVQRGQTDGIYETYEKYRVSRPNTLLCWSIFVLEVALFLLWPFVTLFAIGNYAVAVLFAIVGAITLIRYYINAAIFAKEIGSFEKIGPEDAESDRERKDSMSNREWRSKSRLSAILLNVTRGSGRNAWIGLFTLLAFFVIVYAIASLTSSTAADTVSESDDLVLLGNFSYAGKPGLPYPTCRLKKGLELPGEVDSIGLADYVFLAAMAYQRPENYQAKLDEWFGEGIAKDEEGIVREFRQVVPGGQAPVSYKFVSFDIEGGFGVVIVRGSTTPWEWLTDAQLWSGAAVLGVYRWMLPIGDSFTPIFDEVLQAISFVESKSLQRVSLYKQTTSFIEYLLAQQNYNTLHITGHSLGGGISIISGAQTGIPAIAVSGPNAMMSRRTFDPPITEEALNTQVFNIVPDRDLVPRTDDLGSLYQRIQCRGPKNDIWACHTSTRTLCEILTKCGTGGRPALCDCAAKFGYKKPMQIGGDKNFTESCGEKRSNDGS